MRTIGRRRKIVRVPCSECGSDIPNDAFSCPDCGNPAEEPVGGRRGKDISVTGMIIVILMFIVFPTVVLLLHLLVPGM